MGRLTWKNPDGTWGLNNMDIKDVPRELYGAVCKLKDYEETGLMPEQMVEMVEMDELYTEKCKEVSKIQKQMKSLSAKMEEKELIEEEDILKFYYCESEDGYYIGKRIDTMYYAKYSQTGFVWFMSRNLPWGEHVVDPKALWKEHTYPSEPKEIPFFEWLQGFMKKECLGTVEECREAREREKTFCEPGYLGENVVIGCRDGKCSCGNIVRSYQNYCDSCGIKLEWGNVWKQMKIKQAIINKIGCIVAKWIIHNCDGALVVNRKDGAEQVIKVYSMQEYKNITRSAIFRKGLNLTSPCKVGDTVYVRALCEDVIVKRDSETGTFDCPFEGECEFENCDDANERIFATVVEGIYNNGRGWHYSLRGLCFDVLLSDFGKTVFTNQLKAESVQEEMRRK